jgi:hypothetical protein
MPQKESLIEYCNPLEGHKIEYLPAKILNKHQDIVFAYKEKSKKNKIIYKVDPADKEKPLGSRHMLKLMQECFVTACKNKEKDQTILDGAKDFTLDQYVYRNTNFKVHFDCFRLLNKHTPFLFTAETDPLNQPVTLKNNFKAFGLQKGDMISPSQFAQGIVLYGEFLESIQSNNVELVQQLGHYFHSKIISRPQMLLYKRNA